MNFTIVLRKASRNKSQIIFEVRPTLIESKNQWHWKDLDQKLYQKEIQWWTLEGEALSHLNQIHKNTLMNSNLVMRLKLWAIWNSIFSSKSKIRNLHSSQILVMMTTFFVQTEKDFILSLIELLRSQMLRIQLLLRLFPSKIMAILLLLTMTKIQNQKLCQNHSSWKEHNWRDYMELSKSNPVKERS